MHSLDKGLIWGLTRAHSHTAIPAISVTSPQNPPRLSPACLPVPDSGYSRCRMDRERFEPSGRECPRPGAQTSAWPYGGGDGQRGSAGGRRSLESAVQSQPPGRGPIPACGKRAGRGTAVRACGGHGACCASGSVPEHAPKAAPAVCPGRGRGNPGGGS